MSRVFNKIVVGYEDTPQGRDAFALGQLMARIAKAPLQVGAVFPKQHGLLAIPRTRGKGQVSALCSKAAPAYDGLELRLERG